MPHIRAVIFDMGGTLEELHYTARSRAAAARGLHALLVERGLDPRMAPPDLQAHVLAGMKVYTAWRMQSERELPPEQVWAQYVFPASHLGTERLADAAEALTFFYETRFHTRRLRPEAPALLAALHGRGLRLGVISNIISRTLIPALLAEYGIARYFDPVLTSAGFGWRKPNERIFLEAARLIGVPPAQCAYVGDTVSRDVAGARRAGYALAIQIKSFLTRTADSEADTEQPDAIIQDLMAVADLVARA